MCGGRWILKVTRHYRAAAGLAAAIVLGGCNAFLSEGTADLAGIAGGTLAGALTENAAAATGIGLAVRSLAAAGLDYAERRVQKAEQDEIAAKGGPLAPGEVANWDTGSLPSTSSGSGRVSVAREFALAETRCKEIVFSVDDELRSDFYVALICHSDGAWHWASAEPATARWGSLQ